MAAMAALQSSMTSLSLSSNFFLGQHLSPLTLYPIQFNRESMAYRSEAENKCDWNRTFMHFDLYNYIHSLGSVEKDMFNFTFGCFLWQLKRWERQECNPNSLPILHKMHGKVGDTVKIISGHEKDKIGEITKVLKHNSTVLVKEINSKTKHVKRTNHKD